MGDGEGTAPRILLVSHAGERCGVQQFGRRLFEAVRTSGTWRYLEAAEPGPVLEAIAAWVPDAVLLNHHPATLAWATPEVFAATGTPVVSVLHEGNQADVDAMPGPPFTYALCPDPTLLPRTRAVAAVPRFIPEPRPPAPAPGIFTVGSFGFATPGKGFARLCALVCAQLGEARIRINIPPHDDPAMVPPGTVEALTAECRAAISRPSILLEITQDFLDERALLDFLAANTVNAFLYDDMPHRGISSCTDYALACGRPLAVSRSSMFRHLHALRPSLCVEDRSLRSIAEAGVEPLRHHRACYAPQQAGAAWTAAVASFLAHAPR